MTRKTFLRQTTRDMNEKNIEYFELNKNIALREHET